MKEYWTIKNKNGTWWCRDNYFTSMKYYRGSYTHKIHALEAMVSIINECPGMEKLMFLVHVTVKTKPRGAKVGTWAWACEQMLAGKEVRMAGSGRKYAIANGLIASHLDPYGWHTLPGVFTHMLRGTEWQVVT